MQSRIWRASNQRTIPHFLSTFRTLPESQRDLIFALSVASKDGDWRTAISLLRHGSANDTGCSRGAQQYALTAREWTAAIAACARAPPEDAGPRWRESLGLLDEMRRRGTAPTTAAFNAVMDALSRGRRWQVINSQVTEQRQSADLFSSN